MKLTELNPAMEGKAIRIVPLATNENQQAALRLEIYGAPQRFMLNTY